MKKSCFVGIFLLVGLLSGTTHADIGPTAAAAAEAEKAGGQEREPRALNGVILGELAVIRSGPKKWVLYKTEKEAVIQIPENIPNTMIYGPEVEELYKNKVLERDNTRMFVSSVVPPYSIETGERWILRLNKSNQVTTSTKGTKKKYFSFMVLFFLIPLLVPLGAFVKGIKINRTKFEMSSAQARLKNNLCVAIGLLLNIILGFGYGVLYTHGDSIVAVVLAAVFGGLSAFLMIRFFFLKKSYYVLLFATMGVFSTVCTNMGRLNYLLLTIAFTGLLLLVEQMILVQMKKRHLLE